MALSPQFLDELRARVGLVDIISRRVKLQRKGREHLGLCPFHNEKTPSFTVNEEKGFFHCFGCGAHGDMIGFLMRSEHLSFPEAVERLAGQAGLTVPRSSPQERARAEKLKSLATALEAACAFYERQLRSPSGRECLDYLRRRELDDVTIARFRLGWSAPGNALKAHLLKEGYTEAMLLEAGLLARSEARDETFDYFRGRAMFPIADSRGRVVAFGGRILGEAEGMAKYLNSRDSEIFHKGRMLYGLAHARRGAAETDELVVVEGYMDVIAMHKAGFNTAVAPLGTALTEAQLGELWRLVDEPVLCFDGDAAGQRAAARAAERAIPLLRPGKSLRFAQLPAGEDPDALIRDQGAGVLRELLARARPLVDMVWQFAVAANPADTPERRARLEQQIEQMAQRIRDAAVQRAYRRSLRDRFWQAFGVPRPEVGAIKGEGRGGLRVGRRKKEIPVSGPPASGDVRVLLLRHQQGLLAAIVNHPALMDQVGEAFGTLDLPAGELDKLRREIIKSWVPDIDSETLKGHLRASGFGGILDRVLSAAVPFAGSNRHLDEVAAGWRHSYEFLSLQRARLDIEKAEREHAETMTEESLTRLRALQHQIETDGLDAAVEDRDKIFLRDIKSR